MIKTEVLKIIKSENVNVINNIFEKYNFDEIFIKYNGEIIDYLNAKKRKLRKIMEKIDNDNEKAIKEIIPGIEKIMEDFQKKINDKVKIFKWRIIIDKEKN